MDWGGRGTGAAKLGKSCGGVLSAGQAGEGCGEVCEASCHLYAWFKMRSGG